MSRFEQLASRLGVVFTDQRLLEGALTHRSFWNERGVTNDNLPDSQRLEFLGDAILNYVVAELLFQRFPTADEGELTTMRAALIRATTLAQLAQQLDLGSYLRLGRGEERNGARTRSTLLADSFESLIAAIYLDQGLDQVRLVVQPWFQPLIHQSLQQQSLDAKTRLQHYVQSQHNQLPLYRVIGEAGPEHQRSWSVEVLINELVMGVGQGMSKQEATQQAALEALQRLGVTSEE